MGAVLYTRIIHGHVEEHTPHGQCSIVSPINPRSAILGKLCPRRPTGPANPAPRLGPVASYGCGGWRTRSDVTFHRLSGRRKANFLQPMDLVVERAWQINHVPRTAHRTPDIVWTSWTRISSEARTIVKLHNDNIAVVYVVILFLSASTQLLTQLRLLKRAFYSCGLTVRAEWIPTLANWYADALSRSLSGPLHSKQIRLLPTCRSNASWA